METWIKNHTMYAHCLCEFFSVANFEDQVFNIKHFFTYWLALRDEILILLYGINCKQKYQQESYKSFLRPRKNSQINKNPKFSNQPKGNLISCSCHGMEDFIVETEASDDVFCL
jgi:hypothetical protein